MTLPRLCGMPCYLWYEAATQVAATGGNSFLQVPVWFRLQFENALLASVEMSCLVMAHPALPKYTFPGELSRGVGWCSRCDCWRAVSLLRCVS